MTRIDPPALARALAAVLLLGAVLLTTQPTNVEPPPRPSKAQEDGSSRPALSPVLPPSAASLSACATVVANTQGPR